MQTAWVYIAFFALTFVLTAGLAAAAAIMLDRPGGWRGAGNPAGLSILRDESLSTVGIFEAILERMRFIERLKILLAESETNWSVGRTVAMMLLAAGAAFNLLFRLPWLPLAGAALCSLAAGAAPVLYLRRKREKRFRRVEEQLPEALDFLSRAMLAGHSLPMAMEMLAEEAGPPLSIPLRKTVDEYNLGTSMDEALQKLAVRLPIVDVRFFVSAVLTQSRSGGNLSETLETLAETIRERTTLRGQVRSLTANGRMTGVVLSLLPIIVAGIMMVMNPAYMALLTGHPMGKTLIFAAGCGQILAYWVIRRIVNIKV